MLVLGAGSIGSRHARNLLALGARVTVGDIDGGRASAIDGVDTVAAALDELAAFDGVVVATPTSLHRDHALQALDAGAAVLVEKPLAATVDGLDHLVAAAGDRLTVGYNLRLHAPVERFRDLLLSGRVGEIAHVRVWFGSSLADWRPDRDYRSTYSASAALGGGVLRDASHEIDLLVWLFGADWNVEGAFLQRRSHLEIDVEDVAIALLRAPDGMPAVVMLDAVSAHYRRGIEVVGEDATLRLDWATGVIEIEERAEVTVEDASVPIDESYRREAAAFLGLVRGTTGPVVSAVQGAVSVRLCAAIEEASR